ncbi:MAG: type II toxin-antitoxin system HicA family toxin [Candidatus Tectomicrobia bacterium]|nr:type II toxin-antitoxin system HicA family toxin [Candidatus Tectomicrobia bacterium]
MAIDYSKLRSLTARRIVTALGKDGFSFKRRKGATRFFVHPDGRRVTIHLHSPGQTLKIGTLQEIIENEARWTEDDLRRLGLIK